MMRPTKLQWVIIWAGVLISAHIWLGMDLADLWPHYYTVKPTIPADFFDHPERYPATAPRQQPELPVRKLARGWGLFYYLSEFNHHGDPYAESKAAIVVLVIAALVVWMVAEGKKT